MLKDEKEEIKTIYHQNVKNFFQSIGCYSELKKGAIKCGNCGKIITLENFRIVTKKSNKLFFCCDDEKCLNTFSSCLRGEE
jgi:hypothetical protein